MTEPLGLLHVGAISAPIVKVWFDHLRMVVIAELDPAAEGEVAGTAYIVGMDGSEVWRGTTEHNFGRKELGSKWAITADIDITRRDGEGRFWPPSVMLGSDAAEWHPLPLEGMQ